MRQYYFLMLVIINSFSACISNNNEANKSPLEKAGKNRKELELVLDHYSNQKSDSLKHKAAEYLINNMQNHYADHKTSNTPEYIKSTFEKVNTLTKSAFYDLNNPFSIKDSLNFEDSIQIIASKLLNRNKKVKQPYGKFFDLEEVKSDWLIEHIDNAFDVWYTSPYAKDLDFDEFCETLLNYRFKHEALDLSSKLYREKFYDIIHFNNPDSIEEVVKQFNDYTFYADIFENDGELLGNIGMYDILQFYKYTCERHSEWTARVLNSCGIPTTFDYTPCWQDRRWGHFWVSVRSKFDKYFPFSPKWQELHDTTYFGRVSKVYRRTFKEQNGPDVEKLGKANVPRQFRSTHIKDVTEEYHNVFDITFPLNGISKDLEYAYLCIFTSQEWKPIGWGKVIDDGNKIQFKKVPQNITFIIGMYHNNRITPISQPFFVNSNGNIRKIVPDRDKMDDIKITRKFHKKEKFIEMALDMVDAVIEGANNKDFSDAVNLYILQKSDLSDLVVKEIDLNGIKVFRYLRIKTSNSKDLNLAIFEVYSESEKKLNNTSIQTLPNGLPEKEKVAKNDYTKIPFTVISDTTGYKNIMDGNMETYMTTKSLEIDLGDKRKVKQIRIAPRNANNHVIAGDKYELLYFDKEWISAGVKTSNVNYLIYKDIPSEALLWLKDLDHGQEEQSFIFYNGHQIFVNHDDISDLFK